MRHLLLLLCALACSQPALAADLSQLYANQTLQYWHGRYEQNIRWNFNHLVLGSLTPNEKRKVHGVSLKLPLRAPGQNSKNPLTYYATRDRSIVMPILSIKFFDDLSQAWGYAWSNNLSLENITSYISVLKYHAAPAGGFPPPLKALGIPDNAWKNDKQMDDVSQKIFKSTIVFLMAHELAHIIYKHPGYGPHVSSEQAQANELQADRFANEIMRRIGVAPAGMVNFFMVAAHWSKSRGDFSSTKAWEKYLQTTATHPVTATRLRAMANDLSSSPGDFSATETDRKTGAERVLYIAGQINGIADILDDLDMQRFISGKARGLNLASLNYHPQKAISKASPALVYAGNYRGNFMHRTIDGATEALTLFVTLQRHGNTVNGQFDFGFGNGDIEGVVTGKVMRFQWVLGDAFGQGMLHQSDSGLNGALGYGSSDTDAGSWHLQRKGD
ncbi:MAG: phage exclusion protein Lit family protein [Mariprofundus sp.]